MADAEAVLASDLTNGLRNGCHGNERVCDTVAWIKGCMLINVTSINEQSVLTVIW